MRRKPAPRGPRCVRAASLLPAGKQPEQVAPLASPGFGTPPLSQARQTALLRARAPFTREEARETFLLLGEPSPSHFLRDVAAHREHQTHRLVPEVGGLAEHARTAAVDHGNAVLAAVARG